MTPAELKESRVSRVVAIVEEIFDEIAKEHNSMLTRAPATADFFMELQRRLVSAGNARLLVFLKGNRHG
jgi:hypothetical protein